MSVTDKKAHEPYTGFEKLVVYKDQMEGGLRFSLDPFVKLFLNRYNIALRQLHPNSYRILTGYLELMHREGVEPNFDMLRYIYSLTKKKGELVFFLLLCRVSISLRDSKICLRLGGICTLSLSTSLTLATFGACG